MRCRPIVLLALVLAATSSQALGQAAQPVKPISFRRDVAPILVRSCLGCHNPQKSSNGLDLSTFARLKRGGKASGAEILVPGDPAASELYASIIPSASARMPLKALPLPDEQIRTVETWIKQGATFDGTSETETTLNSLVDPLTRLPKVRSAASPVSPVSSVAFSPDGKWVAAASGRRVVLFDLAKPASPLTLGDHPGPVTSVCFTPDSKGLIAVGGRSGMFGSVVVWNLADKSRRLDLRGHQDAILSADLSSDGKTLATASYDRMIKLWDLSTGKELRTLKEHTDATLAVAFAPDGKVVASSGADRSVKLWRVADGKRLVSSSEPTGEVYALAFSPDGKRLYAGGVDRSIRSWSIAGETSQPSRSTFAHDGPILRLVIGRDGTVFSTGEDQGVRVWEADSLKPIASWSKQSDWPQALAVSPDGKTVAIGRFDGTLALVDSKTGTQKTVLEPSPATKPVAAPVATKPQLFRSATLNPPSPRGAVRGSTTKVTLTGNGVGQAHRVLLPESGLEARLIPGTKPDPNRLDLDLRIAPDARPGVHRIGVQTPLGTPTYQSFIVGEYPEVMEKEPNDRAEQAVNISLPATLTGSIQQPGDADGYRVTLRPNATMVAVARARSFGSMLVTQLELVDAQRKVVASALSSADEPDPVLTFRPEREGTYLLRISDADYGGSAGHFYRVDCSASSEINTLSPLGIEPGRQAKITLRGSNLPGEQRVIEVGPFESAGQVVPTPLATSRTRSFVTAVGPQVLESEPNETTATATKLATPGGVTARIDRPDDTDLFAFSARKGQRLIVEVFGRRLGSPIDPVIEIIDANGVPVPRALLRPVEQTTVAFRDHVSLTRNIRLTHWDHLAVGDLLLVGRELIKLSELPRNPDDDAVFWGLGIPRISSGDRLGLLETTPEQHPMSQPMYKVEVHPPGTKLPSGGRDPVVLSFRNDDGGPGFGKDSRVTFDPPADGTFYARVEDVRGMGGPEFGYQLVIRSPKPDFSVALSTENPNIARRGGTVVTANLTRIDGFAGAVDLEVLGLPPGIRATKARIEPDCFTADFLLMADESAPAFSDPSWTVRATAASADSSQGEPLTHMIDPGGTNAGWITVTQPSDLDIRATPLPVEIRAGERVEITLNVKRGAGFAGRVPIDVRNLPPGVRVLHIGLNGVLVTEQQSARAIFLFAEPWAPPTETNLYAVGKVESTGALSSSPPIPLSVRPAKESKLSAKASSE